VTRAFAIVITMFSFGCGAAVPRAPEAAPSTIPFVWMDENVIEIPVDASGVTGRFMLDTGIGVTLVSNEICARVRCTPAGTYTGRRMSGQEVELALVTGPSLQIGDLARAGDVVGVFDMASLAPGLDGIVSLGFFRSRAVTIDFPAQQIVIETDASLEHRRSVGFRVPLRVEVDEPARTVFVPLHIEGAPAIEAEIDTGSSSLILDQRYLAALGIDPAGEGVRRVEGTDETGHAFVRSFTQLPVPVQLAAAPDVAQTDARVMFQEIIHDGLLGVGFLRPHVVTFDLAHGELVIARPSP
jgi:hypothetical protein